MVHTQCQAWSRTDVSRGTGGPARVVLGRLATLRAAGIAPYLFIELPPDSERDPAFTLNLRLVPDSAPWGLPAVP